MSKDKRQWASACPHSWQCRQQTRPYILSRFLLQKAVLLFGTLLLGSLDTTPQHSGKLSDSLACRSQLDYTPLDVPCNFIDSSGGLSPNLKSRLPTRSQTITGANTYTISVSVACKFWSQNWRFPRNLRPSGTKLGFSNNWGNWKKFVTNETSTLEPLKLATHCYKSNIKK